jgi:hypothetical protein
MSDGRAKAFVEARGAGRVQLPDQIGLRDEQHVAGTANRCETIKRVRRDSPLDVAGYQRPIHQA